MNSSKKIMNHQSGKDDTKASAQVSAKGKTSGGFFGSGHVKPVILGALCIIIVLVLCIGVGIQQLKPQVVMHVGDTKFTMDDMMYPIYEVESQYLPYNEMYESYTGNSVWESQYQGSNSNVPAGSTNVTGLKQEVLDKEVEYEILYQEAVKAKYKLTDKEEKKAEEQAEKAVKGLSWGQKIQLSISKSKLEDRFEKRILADRYKKDQQKEINKGVDEKDAIKDISKKDYREYDVDFYYVPTTKQDEQGTSTPLSDSEIKDLQKKMNEIAKSAKTASDFKKLLEKDEKTIQFESGNFVEKDGWTYLTADNLKQIKKLKNGEISKVIYDKTTNYIVLVKMTNNNSDKSYQSACDSAVTQAQNKAYEEWIAKFKKKSDYKLKLNSELWDDITIGSVTTGIVTAEDLQDMKEDSSDAADSSEKK